MIQSMTGFGKASVQLPTKKITVEIKSLNSKGLDVNTRIPSLYREKDLYVRTTIATALERGKIDFSLFIENTSDEVTTKINPSIIKGYINQIKSIYPTLEDSELLKLVINFPETLKTEREELDENEWQEIEKVIASALKNIQQFRKDEGAILEKEFGLRIENINKAMQKITTYEAQRTETVKARLKSNLDELKATIDENRFEQELIYYIEKYDITEEKVRLSNHLDYFTTTVNAGDANGRKLGFISQEIGREINTMGSKSNHAEMQKLVVLMKDELEKIKEQVLNVL
jgi:uncharacterized protein (TIGR00255 family)